MTVNEKIFDLDEIYLRELRECDLQGAWYQWLNDSEVTRFQNKGTFPNTIEKQKEYFESLKKSQTDVVFAIIYRPLVVIAILPLNASLRHSVLNPICQFGH